MEVTNTSTTFVNVELNNQTLLNVRRDVLELQSRFSQLSTIINELQESTEERLNNLTEQNDKQEKSHLLKELDDLRDYQQRLSTIQRRHQDCLEAGTWLSNNRISLVQQIVSHMQHHFRPNDFAENSFNKISTDQFADDIDVYIRWIGHHLINGTEPDDFPKGLLHLSLPINLYRETFLILRDHYIAPSASGLSAHAANMLASYINLYLLKRDITADA